MITYVSKHSAVAVVSNPGNYRCYNHSSTAQHCCLCMSFTAHWAGALCQSLAALRHHSAHHLLHHKPTQHGRTDYFILVCGITHHTQLNTSHIKLYKNINLLVTAYTVSTNCHVCNKNGIQHTNWNIKCF